MRLMLMAMAIAAMPLSSVMAETGPDHSALDEAVRLGTVAALAPLCGLRAERWSFDLRRAAILEATRGSDPAESVTPFLRLNSADTALREARGSRSVVGALSFAESEALENFAAAPPAETCEPLKIDPELVRGDELVRMFRELRSNIKPAS